jgi:hypothetical protein
VQASWGRVTGGSRTRVGRFAGGLHRLVSATWWTAPHRCHPDYRSVSPEHLASPVSPDEGDRRSSTVQRKTEVSSPQGCPCTAFRERARRRPHVFHRSRVAPSEEGSGRTPSYAPASSRPPSSTDTCCGNGRIRTCVGPFGPSRLAGGCHQPLGHVSICSSAGSRTQIFAFKERRAAITPRRIKLDGQESNLRRQRSERCWPANRPPSNKVLRPTPRNRTSCAYGDRFTGG